MAVRLCKSVITMAIQALLKRRNFARAERIQYLRTSLSKQCLLSDSLNDSPWSDFLCANLSGAARVGTPGYRTAEAPLMRQTNWAHSAIMQLFLIMRLISSGNTEFSNANTNLNRDLNCRREIFFLSRPLISILSQVLYSTDGKR